jgi:diguanylate cyclase (GGDEF)-like protein/PAS domain S-box-containing protein
MVANAPASENPLPPLLESVLGHLAVGVLLLDSRRHVVFANNAIAVMLGMSAEEVVGRSADELTSRVQARVRESPRLVRDGLLFPTDRRLAFEEFEIDAPTRSVVRWLARPVDDVRIRQMVVCEDITVEVDLMRAHERLALTDPLTELLNRRGGLKALTREFHRSRRAKSPLSLVLCDVDRFKVVNDTHGHATGDEMLRILARRLSSEVRGSDLVVRWGGEEFLLGLPDTSLAGARACADRVRIAVAGLEMPSGRVTVSAGIAEVSVAEDLDHALARADASLYVAKAEGRNCVRG